MHVDTLHPSNFLKASDVDSRDFILCIKSLSFEEFDRDEGGKEGRPCLWFAETEKGLVLNKTNAQMIASLYGTETDDWAGKLIAVGSENVPFKGKIVPALRVRGHVPAAGNGQAAQPAPKPEPVSAGDGPDSDLPF